MKSHAKSSGSDKKKKLQDKKSAPSKYYQLVIPKWLSGLWYCLMLLCRRGHAWWAQGCITGLYHGNTSFCKVLYIHAPRASASRYCSLPVFNKWFDIVTWQSHWTIQMRCDTILFFCKQDLGQMVLACINPIMIYSRAPL